MLLHHLLRLILLHVIVMAVLVILMLVVRTLEVAPVVLVARLLLHLVVLIVASIELIHWETLTIVLRVAYRIERVRASLLVATTSIVELE